MTDTAVSPAGRPRPSRVWIAARPTRCYAFPGERDCLEGRVNPELGHQILQVSPDLLAGRCNCSATSRLPAIQGWSGVRRPRRRRLPRHPAGPL